MKRKLQILTRTTIGQSAERFNYPEPSYLFEYTNQLGQKVGRLEGGMSPIGDSFYLFNIEVLPELRRQYYGFSMLADICRAYKVPIAAIHATNKPFWSKVATLDPSVVRICRTIGLNEMAAIRKQWEHI